MKHLPIILLGLARSTPIGIEADKIGEKDYWKVFHC